MQNLHRHTSYSNIFIADSAATNEEYAKRAVELGHKTLSSVEHGWQGNYFLQHLYSGSRIAAQFYRGVLPDRL